MDKFYSNGKLLLTSEYVVLDGIECIALPTNFGQYLSVKKIKSKEFNWISFDYKNHIWFEEKYLISKNNTFQYLGKKNNISDTLLKIFNSIFKLKAIGIPLSRSSIIFGDNVEISSRFIMILSSSFSSSICLISIVFSMFAKVKLK